jgi:hypothetical protein
LLKAKDIYDGLCPKQPARLRERMAEDRFVQLQRKRYGGCLLCRRAGARLELPE